MKLFSLNSIKPSGPLPKYFWLDLASRISVLFIIITLIIFFKPNEIQDWRYYHRKSRNVPENIWLVKFPQQADIAKFIEQIPSHSDTSIIWPSHSKSQNPWVSSWFLKKPHETTNKPFTLRLIKDFRNIVRKFSFPNGTSSLFSPQSTPRVSDTPINFLGPSNSIKSIWYSPNLFSDKSFFSKKILILNTEKSNLKKLTPLGIMGESEILGTVIENLVNQRTLRTTSHFQEWALCILLILISIFFFLILPSSFSLTALLVLAALYSASSFLIFDAIHLWIPLMSPNLAILMTYIVFTNFKLTLNENSKWKIQKGSQEQAEINTMKSNILGLFSHDLKTPLAKIYGQCEKIVSQPNIPAKLSQDIIKIMNSTTEIERYVKHILNISQLESNEILLYKKPCDINQITNQVLSQLEHLSMNKSIEIEKNFSDLFLCHFDENLIREVISNFIENSLLYSPHNSKISIKTLEIDNHIQWCIVDQGPGVDPKIEKKIWEKFFRIDNKEPGYGLGLFLCKFIVELHHGKAYYNRIPDTGSEFGFLIPIGESSS